MFCQNCGKEISEGQSFCPYCGNVTARNQVKAAGYMPAPTAVGNIPNAQPYRQPVNQEKAKKKSKLPKIMAVVVGLVIIAIAAVYVFDPEARLSLKYDFVVARGDGEFFVGDSGEYGVVNEKGEILIPIKYDGVGKFSEEGLCTVELNGKWGFADRNGNEVIPLIYDECKGFRNGIAEVRIDNNWVCIDNEGNIILDIAYETAYYEPEYDVIIAKEHMFRWGAVNRQGEVVVVFKMATESALINELKKL